MLEAFTDPLSPAISSQRESSSNESNNVNADTSTLSDPLLTNLHFACVRSDSLINLNPVSASGYYESGGEDANIFARWSQKELFVKKFVDDISGSEKLHVNNVYNSKVSGHLETRYIHAAQSQELFNRVAASASEKGIKWNASKTYLKKKLERFL